MGRISIRVSIGGDNAIFGQPCDIISQVIQREPILIVYRFLHESRILCFFEVSISFLRYPYLLSLKMFGH